MTGDNQLSVILLYHTGGGGTTRPSKDQTLSRIYTLSDTTQYSDCLETEGFDSRWEREIFLFSTAPSLPAYGCPPGPIRWEMGAGKEVLPRG